VHRPHSKSVFSIQHESNNTVLAFQMPEQARCIKYLIHSFDKPHTYPNLAVKLVDEDGLRTKCKCDGVALLIYNSDYTTRLYK
jgi:hypothetical protein